MKVLFQQVVFVLVILISLVSCSDDFELNAPYSRQAVVYGLLDPSQDQQVIMINHTFLGGGSAISYAQVEDSSTYSNIEARVFWNDGANSVLLSPTIIDDKDGDGLFYAPNQLVYTAPTSDFDFDANENDIYRLGVMADGDTIFSSTSLVEFPSTSVKRPLNNVDIAFVKSSSTPLSPKYKDNVLIRYFSVPSAIKHSVVVRLSYTNHYLDSSPDVDTYTEIIIRNDDAQDSDGGEEIKYDYNAESFYQTLGNRIADDDNIDFRDVTGLSFTYFAYSESLSTYLSIANPSSGVGQGGAQYSNINDGEGIGVFAARSKKVRNINGDLDARSLQELIQGQYTGHLHFCQSGDPTFGCQ